LILQVSAILFSFDFCATLVAFLRLKLMAIGSSVTLSLIGTMKRASMSISFISGLILRVEGEGEWQFWPPYSMAHKLKPVGKCCE
jgi:hypothetical protein